MATTTEPRTARIFRNGRNQAVRLPKEFALDTDEVLIRREGDCIVLEPKGRTWADYFQHGRRLDAEFPDTLPDLPTEQRDF